MPKTIQIQGTLVARNLSPRGDWEGVLVETEKGIVQVNLPKHGARLTKPLDGHVDLTVVKHEQLGKHPVYELSQAAAPSEGKVVRFNYSRHGEVNGYHLDTGAMIHVKPDGARRAKVKVGDDVVATGELRQGADGVVIEAEKVRKAK